MNKSHEIDYEILGNGIQVVDPNEPVIAEAGAIIYRNDGFRYHGQQHLI